jgi:hypothetical protein
MGGILERARGVTQHVTDVAAAQVDAVRSGVADLDVAAFGAEKVQELLAALDAAAPFISEAGYELVHAFVELGLPPRLVVRARRVRQITDEEEATLRERAAESTAGSLALRTFLAAAALQRTLSSRSFEASEIEFELTTLPRARLYFEHHPSKGRSA